MRLLTYNIHKGIGGRDRRYNLQRVIDVVRDENPDLVCLQEVDRHVGRSSNHDQPRMLAHALGMEHHLYQLNVKLKHGGYGNLMLSRWPLMSQHAISLRLQEKKPRGALIATIRTPEGRLQLVNTHLGLAEAERQWQIRRLLDHHLFDHHEDLPTWIAGDANDWRNTLAASALADYGFVQATSPPRRFRSFPAWFALGALDKAFCRAVRRVNEVRVVRSALTRVASDHLPLVVDFSLV